MKNLPISTLFQPISLASYDVWTAGISYHAFTSSQYSSVNLLTSRCKYNYAWMLYQDKTLIYNAKDDVLGIPDLHQFSIEDVLRLSAIGQAAWAKRQSVSGGA